MIIRKAKKEDMGAVLQLIKELAQFHNKLEAVRIHIDDPVHDGFSGNPLFHCQVAESNVEIIGMAIYYFTYSTWVGKTLHLEDLVVKENKRGSGAGSALYKEVIQEGFRENVGRLEWLVADWNKPAIEFYKKIGAKISEGSLAIQMNKESIDLFVNTANEK